MKFKKVDRWNIKFRDPDISRFFDGANTAAAFLRNLRKGNKMGMIRNPFWVEPLDINFLRNAYTVNKLYD